MEYIRTFNFAVAVIFFICYFYQFVYVPLAICRPVRAPAGGSGARIAVCICARNEEAVLPFLLGSLAGQDYPAELLTRRNTEQVGKGWALEYLLRCIERDEPSRFDAFLVLDADNVLEPDFVSAMAATFASGFNIVTSRRNSKNYGDNWISAGYGLWFLRESRYLNGARMALGTSCAVSGTGFLFSRSVLERAGGWRWHLLTEDIEFSARQILDGERIAYCPGAVLYDEQPTRFSQSWRQRMRWSRGYMQVLSRFGPELARRTLRGDFSSFDMVMNIAPAFLLSTAAFLVNGAALIWCALRGDGAPAVLLSALEMVKNACLTVFMLGAVTTVTEWRDIHCPGWKKILYMFTFPLFMLTYIPIAVSAMFCRVGWKPIEHTRSRSLSQIKQ